MKNNSCLVSLAKIALLIGAPAILGAGYAIHNTPMIYAGLILVGVLLVVVPRKSLTSPKSLIIAKLADLARAGNLNVDKATRAFCRAILSRLENVLPDDEDMKSPGRGEQHPAGATMLSAFLGAW